MNDCDICKLSKCFWCGGEKNELILATKQTKEWCDNKSMSVIANYDPCDKCKEVFAKGIQIIEAQDDPMYPNQPAIVKGVYPTGKYWVIKKGILEGIPEDQPHVFITEDVARETGLYDAPKENKLGLLLCK